MKLADVVTDGDYAARRSSYDAAVRVRVVGFGYTAEGRHGVEVEAHDADSTDARRWAVRRALGEAVRVLAADVPEAVAPGDYGMRGTPTLPAQRAGEVYRPRYCVLKDDPRKPATRRAYRVEARILRSTWDEEVARLAAAKTAAAEAEATREDRRRRRRAAVEILNEALDGAKLAPHCHSGTGRVELTLEQAEAIAQVLVTGSYHN